MEVLLSETWGRFVIVRSAADRGVAAAEEQSHRVRVEAVFADDSGGPRPVKAPVRALRLSKPSATLAWAAARVDAASELECARSDTRGRTRRRQTLCDAAMARRAPRVTRPQVRFAFFAGKQRGVSLVQRCVAEFRLTDNLQSV